MKTDTVQTAAQWKDKGISYAIEHGGAILSAIFIFVAGIIIAGWLAKLILRGLERKQLEPPVKMLIGRFVRLLVIIFAAIIALGTCGVQVMPLVAGIGVAGIGVGLAMQGVLSNLVAGLTIIFTKPFRVGEYIEVHNVQGQVSQIELFVTTLIHPDRSRIIVPNRKVVGEILHNYGTIRQLNLEIGVAYATDLNKVQAAVREVLHANVRVLKDPVPLIGVSNLADSSIVVSVKPWTAVADFGMARAELNQAIIEKFRASEISIPFPQREIRVLNKNEAA
ncbi:MAG: mechanosensitive ion channel domain-containing protein, partial [Verrucomicrobiota bacterium]